MKSENLTEIVSETMTLMTWETRFYPFWFWRGPLILFILKTKYVIIYLSLGWQATFTLQVLGLNSDLFIFFCQLLLFYSFFTTSARTDKSLISIMKIKHYNSCKWDNHVLWQYKSEWSGNSYLCLSMTVVLEDRIHIRFISTNEWI